MNNICPVCGCKTEELDFSPCSFSGQEVSVCSYCRKQLTQIDSESELSESSVRWLDNILSREVPGREQSFGKSLLELRGRPVAKVATPVTDSVVDTSATGASRQAQSGYPFNTAAPEKRTVKGSEMSIEELEKRFLKLEHDFHAFKKRLLLTSIAEIVIPFILMIILVIIFLNSGLMDSLKNIVSAGTGGAVNYPATGLFGRIML